MRTQFVVLVGCWLCLEVAVAVNEVGLEDLLVLVVVDSPRMQEAEPHILVAVAVAVADTVVCNGGAAFPGSSCIKWS